MARSSGKFVGGRRDAPGLGDQPQLAGGARLCTSWLTEAPTSGPPSDQPIHQSLSAVAGPRPRAAGRTCGQVSRVRGAPRLAERCRPGIPDAMLLCCQREISRRCRWTPDHSASAVCSRMRSYAGLRRLRRACPSGGGACVKSGFPVLTCPARMRTIAYKGRPVPVFVPCRRQFF